MTLPKKPCGYCGKPIPPYDKFCGRACMTPFFTLPKINCATCGISFAPKSVRTRFCSRSCRAVGQAGKLPTMQWMNAIPIDRRFQYKVYQRGDCWEWRGSRSARGYGFFMVRDALGVYKTGAHRYAYEMAKGHIPANMELDHLCKHTWCVRPSHLEVVTSLENNRRSDSICARHGRKTHCKNGHPLEWHPSGLYRWCQDCTAARRRERYQQKRNAA